MAIQSVTAPAKPVEEDVKVKPNDIEADFNYFKDLGDGKPPKPSIIGKPETYDRPVQRETMIVHDIRGDEDKFSLDKTGFLIYKHDSKEKDFRDEAKIKENYYPEIEKIMKELTGASRVAIFDHTVRRQPPGQPPKSNALSDPVQRVHVDQSYKAAPDRVRRHLPDEADHLLKGRFEVVNAWKPITTIRKDPLGIVDASTCPDSDLLPDQLIFPDRIGETFTVLPNKAHRWYYMHEQAPEEILIFRCFDSRENGGARRAPHSAFEDSRYVDEPSRESIEVRALVFHVDDPE